MVFMAVMSAVYLGNAPGKAEMDQLRTELETIHSMYLSPTHALTVRLSRTGEDDKQMGLTKAFDSVDACLVRFFTHKSKAHGNWTRALKDRLGSLAKESKKVHPDYRDAIPKWLKPVTIMRPESP